MVSKMLSNLGCLTHEITLSPGSNYIGKIWGFTARFSDLQWKQMPPNELKMTFVRTQYCKAYIFSDTHTYIQEYILITDISFFLYFISMFWTVSKTNCNSLMKIIVMEPPYFFLENRNYLCLLICILWWKEIDQCIYGMKSI